MQKLVMPLAIVISALSLGAVPDRHRPAVSLRGAHMTIESMPGVEAVLRISAESEGELEGVRVLRPDGQSLIELNACAPRLRGLGGLELELPAPTLEGLRKSYAEGLYDIQAVLIDGRPASGSALLSFDLPAAPIVLHPRARDVLSGSSVTVLWQRARDAAGYELQVEQGEDDGLRVKLPPEQTMFRVPAGFLAPATETTLELAAIGANGNRTLTEVRFVTAP